MSSSLYSSSTALSRPALLFIQLRLCFLSLAYVFRQAMRQFVLVKSDMSKAQGWTIRNQLDQTGAGYESRHGAFT